jgi:hypothetical protein
MPKKMIPRGAIYVIMAGPFILSTAGKGRYDEHSGEKAAEAEQANKYKRAPGFV